MAPLLSTAAAPRPRSGRSTSRARLVLRLWGTRPRGAVRPAQRRRRLQASDVAHFEWQRGQQLGPDGRYVVRRHLDDGTFGRVLGCKDTQSLETVAIKVVKGLKRYQRHAKVEAGFLQLIRDADPCRQSRCVLVMDHFLHSQRYYCLVFEHLDVTVRDFMLANDNHGLLMSDVVDVARQMLQCLSFLSALKLIHTDIKCRNVLLRDGRCDQVPLPRSCGDELTSKLRSNDIVLIDFGGVVAADDHGSGCIGTRQFRAPEVVLGMPWDEKVDVWSAGCLIAMTFLGKRLFDAMDGDEHLAFMERCLGQQLSWPACKGPRPPLGLAAKAGVERAVPLQALVAPRHGAFWELLMGMLQLAAGARLTAAAAARLPLFVGPPLSE